MKEVRTRLKLPAITVAIVTATHEKKPSQAEQVTWMKPVVQVGSLVINELCFKVKSEESISYILSVSKRFEKHDKSDGALALNNLECKDSGALF